MRLEFKPTFINYQNIYLCEPYKVVHYDWTNNGTIEKSNWRAYHRIKCPVTHKWLFGDSVEMIERFKSKEYDTKEQAFEACQKHFESEVGKELIKDHKRYFKE
jgi:hypothetical protein